MIYNGKEAIKIEAKPLLWGSTEKSRMYKIKDTDVWIPKSVSTFCPYPQQGSKAEPIGELIVQKWFYDKNIRKSAN